MTQAQRAESNQDPIEVFKDALSEAGLSTRRTSKDGYKLIGFTFRRGDKKWIVERVEDGKCFYATSNFVTSRFLMN